MGLADRTGSIHHDGPTQGGNGMGLIITLVIGGIVGWLASILMKTNAQMGLIANVIVGIVGAAIGSWIGAQLGMTAGWILSIVGAVILIAILKAVGVFK
jgi:uncharacterized membrane protein YeaQ/YmgE (transglycosylase-associated protein family)